MSMPVISVVIPSHQRRELLEKVLSGLAVQSTEEEFEVIVVLDGCADGSREMLELWRDGELLANLSWIEQPHSGQAIARNAGVERARSPLILFLDDDVIPEIDLLSVHLAHHTSGERIAVLGDCEIVGPSSSLYSLALWRWWEDTYHRRSAPGQPASFRDFCSGNVSVRKADFVAVGGFDPAFHSYGREDYELGYRFLLGGVRFVADRRARGWHHHQGTVASVLKSAREEATGDVLVARKHPELIQGLRLAVEAETRVARLAMRAPRLGDIVMRFERRRLNVYERIRRRRKWDHTFQRLRRYAYWRGIRNVLGSTRSLRELVGSSALIMEQDIDLAADVPGQLGSLWINAPTRLVLRYGDEHIGTLDLPAELDEPLLDYLVQELQTTMGASLLSILGREPAGGRASAEDPA